MTRDQPTSDGVEQAERRDPGHVPIYQTTRAMGVERYVARTMS